MLNRLHRSDKRRHEATRSRRQKAEYDIYNEVPGRRRTALQTHRLYRKQRQNDHHKTHGNEAGDDGKNGTQNRWHDELSRREHTRSHVHPHANLLTSVQ